MKTFLEVAIDANAFQREALIPSLAELGCEGFQETDDALLCYFDISDWPAGAAGAFESTLRSLLHTFSANIVFRFREIQEMNWNEEWERSIRPIEIGRRLVIRPSWTEYTGDPGRLVLTIDPKMSFGTGYHESTRLILRLLEQSVLPGDDVLDLGTGTGVLAIAAVKLGAHRADAIDIDEWSIDNARENCIANGVEGRIAVSDAPLSSFPGQRYTLILANIMASTITELFQDIVRVQRGHGRLLLAGLLATDRPAMLTLLTKHGYRLTAEEAENEWIALAAEAP